MTSHTSPMLERLQEFLERKPNDSFVRYGLAMELGKLGRAEESIAQFRQLVANDPDYVAGYMQGGLALARAGRRDEARALLRAGVEAAARRRDEHAQAEMAGFLAELEQS